jgi:hypothetical protein
MVAALLVGFVVGVPIGLLTRGSPPSSSATSTTPQSNGSAARAKALYRQALAATSGSLGFHYVSVSGGDTGSQKIVGDAGPHGGGQLITLDSSYGSEQFTLVLVNGTVYFQGNTPALEDQLGVPAASAPGIQGKWVSVGSSDGPYGVVAPGITVTDQAQQMTLVPTSTLRVTGGGGVRATRIAGTVPAQQGAPSGIGHLDIATASHLPISYVAVVTDNGVTITSTTTFSGWGTPPAVAAPPSTVVAWSTLGATQPPGGYGGGGVLAPTPSSGV